MNTFTEKPANRREAQKAETRAKILAVARAHFEEHGFDAASVRAIAEAAGVAAGTVLLHFTDKRDLLHAALFDDLEQLVDDTIQGPTDGAIETQLQDLARPFFGYYAERPQLSRTLLREALLAEEPWRERFTAQVARVHARIVQLVDEAKARGELAEHANGALVGASFFSFYYFALIGWVQGGFPDPAPLFERLLAEHLRGARPAVTNTSKKRSR